MKAALFSVSCNCMLSSCCIDAPLYAYGRQYMVAEAAYERGDIEGAKRLVNNLESKLATNPRFLWHTSKSLKKRVKTLKDILESEDNINKSSLNEQN